MFGTLNLGDLCGVRTGGGKSSLNLAMAAVKAEHQARATARKRRREERKEISACNSKLIWFIITAEQKLVLKLSYSFTYLHYLLSSSSDHFLQFPKQRVLGYFKQCKALNY